jgi:hypothetical protein
MTINTAAISPKEFGIFIAEESTVGTVATGSAFKGIEVESISMPTFNDLRVMEQRSGSDGRVVNEDDLLQHEAGAVHEISISGVLTLENAPILLENAFGKEVAASTANGETANFITMASGYEHVHFLHGAGSSGGHNTISILIQGHSVVNSSYRMKSCVITSLTLSANSQENGGRFNFEMTAQTRDTVSSAPGARESSPAAYTSNFVYLADFTEEKVVMDHSVILDAFSLSVENPVAFLGNKKVGAVDGLPESYLRGVPNLNVTANCVVKFDANTADFFNLSRTLDVSTSGLFLSNNATFASGSAFGINIPKAIIEEVSYDESDYLKLSTTLKMIDGGSGNMIMIRKPA